MDIFAFFQTLVVGSALSFFLFRMFPASLLSVFFIMLRYVPCIPNLSKTFIMLEILVKGLSSSSDEKTMQCLSFSMFIWRITFIILHMLNHPHISG